MKEKKPRKVLVSVYIDPAWLARFKPIEKEIRKQLFSGLARVSRADAVRAALSVGLDTIERDGLPTGRKGDGDK